MSITVTGIRNERGQSPDKLAAVTVQPKTASTNPNKFQMKPKVQFANTGGMPLAVIARSLSGLRQDPGTKKPTLATIRKLTKQLRHRDEYMRDEAADDLMDIASKWRLPIRTYIALFGYSTEWNLKAVEDLAKIGRVAVPALRRVLRRGKPAAKALAAKALGEIGSKARSAVPTLKRALRDRDEEVRQWAADALVSILPKGRVPIRAQLIHGNYEDAGFVKALAAKGRAIVPTLLRFLRDRDAEVREMAALVLGAIGPAAKKAVPSLTKALGDTYPSVKAAAALALGKMGPVAKSAIPKLMQLLHDRDSRPSRAAARALAKVAPKPQAVVAKLTKLLRHKLYLVRHSASFALGEFGPAAKSAIPALRKIIADRTMQNEDAALALIKIKASEKTRISACVYLLNNTLKKSDVIQAANELVKIGASAVPALLKFYSSAPSEFYRDRAVRALRRLLKHPDVKVRKAAAESLKKIKQAN